MKKIPIENLVNLMCLNSKVMNSFHIQRHELQLVF